MNEEALITVVLVVLAITTLAAIFWSAWPFQFTIRHLPSRHTSFLLHRPSYRYWSFPSVSELMLWADEFEVSIVQIRAIYEWRIEQWSSFGKAVLTATLAFVSAVVIAALKGEIDLSKSSGFLIVCDGILVSIAAFLFCQRKISLLRQEFQAIFNLLSMLR